MKNIILSLLAVTLSAGCMTTPRESTVLASSEALQDDEGTILVCRPLSFVASGWSPDIYINDKLVAEISSGSLVEIVVLQGSLSVDFKHISFEDRNNDGKKSFGLRTSVKAGEVKHLMMGPDLDTLIVSPALSTIGASVLWRVIEVNDEILKNNCKNSKPRRFRLKK
jgi:hypothetical protein